MTNRRRFSTTSRLAPTLLAVALAWVAPGFGQDASASYDDRSPSAANAPSREDIERFADVEDVPAFARVRYEENGVDVVRKDGFADELRFNAAIYEGDRVTTRADQRAEFQLPDGTLVRLDRASTLEFYALAEPRRGDRRASVVGLVDGSMQVEVPDPQNGEAFRIDTAAASVYPLEPSSFRVDLANGTVVKVSVERGRVEVAGESGSRVLYAGERARVTQGSSPGRAYAYNVMLRDSFDQWVSRRDDVYGLRAERGPEYDELPEDVRPYYGELSAHGRWVRTDEWGWVWNPDVDDDWRPYYDGYWSTGPWGPVWVSSESWGWPVYRYGRWEYSTGWGWTWIPGRVFRPAHVVWYYGPSYVGWCPLGYWNTAVYVGPRVHWSIGWGWSYFDYHPWVFVGYNHFWYHPVPRAIVPRGRVIPADLRRGVVTRASVVSPADVRGARASRAAAVRDVGLPQDRVYERAQALARTRGDVAQRADQIRDERENAAAARTRQSFRDVEREVGGSRNARRVGARDDDGDSARTSAAERSRGGAGERGQPAVEPQERDAGSAPGRTRGSSGSVRERSTGPRDSGASAPSRGSGSSDGSSRGSSGASGTRGRAPGDEADARPVIRYYRGAQRDALADRNPSPSTPAEEPGAAAQSAPAGAAEGTRNARAPQGFPRAATPDDSRERGAVSREAGDKSDARAPASNPTEGVRRFFGELGGQRGNDAADVRRGLTRQPAATAPRATERPPTATAPRRETEERPPTAPRRETTERTPAAPRRESAERAPTVPRRESTGSSNPAPPRRESAERPPAAPRRESTAGRQSSSSTNRREYERFTPAPRSEPRVAPREERAPARVAPRGSEPRRESPPTIRQSSPPRREAPSRPSVSSRDSAPRSSSSAPSRSSGSSRGNSGGGNAGRSRGR